MTKRNTETELSPADLADISERVSRVGGLLRKSAALWLDVAKEFVDAKDRLRNHLAYERFVHDVGFTKAVADKLICVGKCKRLYEPEAEPFIGFVDGWSTLYEVSKLEDHQVTELWDALRADPSKRLSRSVVHKIAAGIGADAKTLVYVTIDGQESDIGSLTPPQIVAFEKFLEDVRHKLAELPKAFVVHESKAAIKKLETQKTLVASDGGATEQKAA